MAVGLLPALGNLTSLTNGGAFTAATPASAAGDSAVGPVNIGGLNVPALPGDNRLLIVGGLALAGLWLLTRRRR